MTETKYGKYILREPIEQGSTGVVVHACAEPGCVGANHPNWPGEQTMVLVREPRVMNPQPHAHEYDQWLWFFGPNPGNFFEFDGEVEVYLGDEGEKHTINTTSLVFVPKGLVHCPLKFTKVNKPILFVQLCFNPTYTRSVGDMSGHPPHSTRIKFPPEEAAKLRGRPLPDA